MPELGSYGSVRGARGNSRPYREYRRYTLKPALLTHNGCRQVTEGQYHGEQCQENQEARSFTARQWHSYWRAPSTWGPQSSGPLDTAEWKASNPSGGHSPARPYWA